MILFVLLVGFGIWWFFGKTEKTIANSSMDDNTKTIIMIVIAIVFAIAWGVMGA